MTRINYMVAMTMNGHSLTIRATSSETFYYQVDNGEWSRAYKTREEAEQDARIKIYNL